MYIENLDKPKVKRFYRISKNTENRSMYITPNGEIMILQDQQNPSYDISHSLFDVIVFGKNHHNEYGIEFIKAGYIRCRIDPDLTFLLIDQMPNTEQLSIIENNFSTINYNVYLINKSGQQMLANKNTLKEDIQLFIKIGGKQNGINFDDPYNDK